MTAAAASAFHAAKALLSRDLRLAARRRSEWLQPLLFLLVVVSLFPIGVGPESNLLGRIAAGVIWIAALLATVLSLDHLFRSDAEDGSLEQMLISGHPVSALAAVRLLAHWLTSGLPIVLLSPLLALWMNLPGEAVSVLMATLLLGTPILALLGGVGAALTVGLRRGGQLLSLLVFPLYVPVLIAGTGAVDAAVHGLSYAAPLALLGAGLLASLSVLPFIIAVALRISHS
ncbi:MAG: heme exporter protein CcmB [Xanthomonadales bacterium]|nr:heme exporter protein CcmB [Xanthomonadales bacterium]